MTKQILITASALLAILLVVNLLVVNAPGYTKPADQIFFGSEEFEKEQARLDITLDQARQFLEAHLSENELNYFYCPEEVIMIHEGGYLFIVGDFKLNIQLEGYHVNPEGEVSEIDLDQSIKVGKYMDLVGKDGWESWIHDE